MPKHAEPRPRSSFIQNLFRRGKKNKAETGLAEKELDATLSRLASALNENASVVEGVRRRQCDGALRLVTNEASIVS